MLKKTITYTDYDGNERTEDFYFNLSKPELMEMAVTSSGSMDKLIEKIIQTQDQGRLIEIFKDFVVKAYGEKSPDGKRFIKSKEMTEAFTQTEAYSEIFMELATDADAATEFFNGILPNDLEDFVEQQRQKQEKQLSIVEKKDHAENPSS